MSRSADQDVERRDPPVLMGNTDNDGRPLRWFKADAISVTYACRVCNAFHDHDQPCGDDTLDLSGKLVRPDADDLTATEFSVPGGRAAPATYIGSERHEYSGRLNPVYRLNSPPPPCEQHAPCPEAGEIPDFYEPHPVALGIVLEDDD